MGKKRYWRMPQKKSKKEYKVGGSRSRFFKEVLEQVKGEFGYRLQCSNDASCVQCEAVGQLGKLQRGMQEGRKAVWMDCKKASGGL